MATNIKFVTQNEVEDVFSYIDENGEEQWIRFPRTMDMKVADVENFLKI